MLLFGLLVSASAAHAEVLWQDFSVTYLNGSHYRVGDPQRQVYTFESVTGASWGDSFLFIDHLRSANGERENYGEWAPRFSLSKNGWLSKNEGFIKDVLLAGQIEMSETRSNYLYGVGLDLAIPGFKFVQLNLYRRDNEQVADNWQSTVVWNYPMQFGQQTFVWDGFIDWTNSTADQRASMNWTSQIKWLASPSFGLSSRLYLGVEYAYWRNKFGIADTAAFRSNENNVSLLLKWHF